MEPTKEEKRALRKEQQLDKSVRERQRLEQEKTFLRDAGDKHTHRPP